MLDRKLVVAVAGWACVALLTTIGPGGAFLWFLVLPFYLVVLVTRVIQRCLPSTRHRTSLSLLWIGPAIFLVCLPVYFVRANEARSAGDHVVDVVAGYRQAHGSYPESGEAAGLAPYLDQHRGVFYFYSDGKPSVGYASPWIVFEGYRYDFTAGAWMPTRS